MMMALSRPLVSCHGPAIASTTLSLFNSGSTRSLKEAAGNSHEDRSIEDRTAQGQDPSGLTPGAYGGATAGSDAVPGPGPHKEQGQAEGGTSGGIAGAWRGMTSSFTVGADDMARDNSAGTVEEDMAMKVNPDDTLPPGPSETSGAAAAARAGGFGQQRDPQAGEGGEVPADLAQKAREINTPGAQEDATASGPKPWAR